MLEFQARYHREHEKFYASSPRELAVALQRHARTLHTLADRWATVTPSTGHRAADILDHVDLTPAGLRADLAGPRQSAGIVRSAAELIDRATDLCSDSAGLVNDNERRWRVFRERVGQITGTTG